MSKTSTMRSVVMAFAAALTVVASTGHAEAASTWCNSVPWVDFDYTYGGRLQIGCTSGSTTVGIFGFVSYSGCSSRNVPLDVIKIWKATADEALLSGKELNVYWETCPDGNKVITTVSLRK